jgi:hypothetical protein
MQDDSVDTKWAASRRDNEDNTKGKYYGRVTGDTWDSDIPPRYQYIRSNEKGNFLRSWGTDRLEDADQKWGKVHSSASSQENKFPWGNDHGHSRSVHARNAQRKYAEDLSLEELQDNRNIRSGITYSSTLQSLPVTKTEIATVQEMMGQKDFVPRSDGPREKKEKHDKCDHSNDLSAQRADN